MQPRCARRNCCPRWSFRASRARAGGLSFGEAASFSWRPWVIARALLPAYGDPLFPEYIAYLGVAGLALAMLGGLQILNVEFWILNRRHPSAIQNSKSRIQNSQILIPLLLVLIGFILALGVVTPAFNVLYRYLPGFNLFRAQARWLIMFAMGASLLIGFGVQRLQTGLNAKQARTWLVAWLVLMGLMVIGLLAGARVSLDPEYRSLPARSVLMGWGVAAMIVSALIIGYWLLAKRADGKFSP